MGVQSSKFVTPVDKIGAKPLDLLLFSSDGVLGDFVGVMQTLKLGKGKWTHAGIVVTSELMPKVKAIKPGKLYVLESVIGFDAPDIEGTYHRSGPQIRDLEEILRTEYRSGTVALFKVKENPFRTGEGIKEARLKFKEIFNEVSQAKYDLLGGFPGLFKCCRKVEEISIVKVYIDETYFCSELVAYVYKKFGIISSDIDPAHVVTEDFLGGDEDGMVIEFEGAPVLIK